jgi:hypothetical protein
MKAARREDRDAVASRCFVGTLSSWPPMTAAFTCGVLDLRHTTGAEKQAQLLHVGQVGSNHQS